MVFYWKRAVGFGLGGFDGFLRLLKGLGVGEFFCERWEILWFLLGLRT